MSPTSSRLVRLAFRGLFATLIVVLGLFGLAKQAQAQGYVGETRVSPHDRIDIMCIDPVSAACVINAARTNANPTLVQGSGYTTLDVALDACKSMYLSHLARAKAQEQRRTLIDLFEAPAAQASQPAQKECRQALRSQASAFESALSAQDRAFHGRRRVAAEAAARAAQHAPEIKTVSAATQKAHGVTQEDIEELDRLGSAALAPPAAQTSHQMRPRNNVVHVPAKAAKAVTEQTVRPTRTARYNQPPVVVAHRATTDAQLKCVPEHAELLFVDADKLTFYVDKGAQTDALLNCLGPDFRRETKREYIESLPSVNTIPWRRINGRIELDPVRGNPAKALKTDLNGPPNKEFLDESQEMGAEIGFALQGRQRITFTAKAKTIAPESPVASKPTTLTPPAKVSRRILAGSDSADQPPAAVPASSGSTDSVTPNAPSTENNAAPLGRAFQHDRTMRSEQVRRAALPPLSPVSSAECTGSADDACAGATRATSPPGR